ncbi:hypothetical protein AB0I55_20800 [Actinocatenispora sera]|uniref:hypothetical protein n=1 Tax=Actinocatenispora sera TaxID=390989 RepID=UPI0033EA2811
MKLPVASFTKHSRHRDTGDVGSGVDHRDAERASKACPAQPAQQNQALDRRRRAGIHSSSCFVAASHRVFMMASEDARASCRES